MFTVKLMHMLCFHFIFSGLNFIFLCFNLFIINYHTQKYNKFKLRIKLNHKVSYKIIDDKYSTMICMISLTR